ncbi:hypothetical protein J2W96_005741 [Variovorax guangxiensis]|nr:hypothetical protein [Variovorax guangxiensis]
MTNKINTTAPPHWGALTMLRFCDEPIRKEVLARLAISSKIQEACTRSPDLATAIAELQKKETDSALFAKAEEDLCKKRSDLRTLIAELCPGKKTTEQQAKFAAGLIAHLVQAARVRNEQFDFRSFLEIVVQAGMPVSCTELIVGGAVHAIAETDEAWQLVHAMQDMVNNSGMGRAHFEGLHAAAQITHQDTGPWNHTERQWWFMPRDTHQKITGAVQAVIDISKVRSEKSLGEAVNEALVASNPSLDEMRPRMNAAREDSDQSDSDTSDSDDSNRANSGKATQPIEAEDSSSDESDSDDSDSDTSDSDDSNRANAGKPTQPIKAEDSNSDDWSSDDSGKTHAGKGTPASASQAQLDIARRNARRKRSAFRARSCGIWPRLWSRLTLGVKNFGAPRKFPTDCRGGSWTCRELPTT